MWQYFGTALRYFWCWWRGAGGEVGVFHAKVKVPRGSARKDRNTEQRNNRAWSTTVPQGRATTSAVYEHRSSGGLKGYTSALEGVGPESENHAPRAFSLYCGESRKHTSNKKRSALWIVDKVRRKSTSVENGEPTQPTRDNKKVQARSGATTATNSTTTIGAISGNVISHTHFR